MIDSLLAGFEAAFTLYKMLFITGVCLPSQSMFDVGVMLAFAALGLLMTCTGFSVVCMVTGFVLGESFETSMRKSALLYKGDWSVIVESPIATLFFVLAFAVIMRAIWRQAKARG